MKKILAGIMAAAMAVTTVAGFAFTSSATTEDVKGVIPRTDSDVVLDGVADEDFWEGAYVEELNETTAVLKETMLDDIPTEDLPSLTIKMVYYSEFPDDEDPDNMMYIFDENGGIIVYMEVVDKHKAFAFGATTIDANGTTTMNGYPNANATDCVQLLFDPMNADGLNNNENGCTCFSFVPYSIVAPENAISSAPGVGNCAGGPGWWWQHWGGGAGYGDNPAYALIADSVELVSETSYVFDEEYPLPTKESVPNDTSRYFKIMQAYQFASIEGYRIEAKLHWNLFEIESNMEIKPVKGEQFGMGIGLIDYMFDAPWTTPAGSAEIEPAQKVYRSYLNFGDEDEGWTSVDVPKFFNTYEFGGYIGEEEPSGLLGDANNDGQVDIEDAMMVFYHVAKKSLLTDDEASRCDVTKDGNIDIEDAMNIFYYVAKKIPGLE